MQNNWNTFHRNVGRWNNVNWEMVNGSHSKVCAPSLSLDSSLITSTIFFNSQTVWWSHRSKRKPSTLGYSTIFCLISVVSIYSLITYYATALLYVVFFFFFFGCIFSLAHWVALMVCPASSKLEVWSRNGVLTTCEPEKWKQFLVGLNIHASRKNKTKTKADKSRISLRKCVYIIVTLTKHSSDTPERRSWGKNTLKYT